MRHVRIEKVLRDVVGVIARAYCEVAEPSLARRFSRSMIGDHPIGLGDDPIDSLQAG